MATYTLQIQIAENWIAQYEFYALSIPLKTLPDVD